MTPDRGDERETLAKLWDTHQLLILSQERLTPGAALTNRKHQYLLLIISEERLTPGAPSTNRKHQYLFHDHLGSVDVIVEAESLGNSNQGLVDRKSYNTHG